MKEQLLALLVCAAFTTQAQTTILSDNFDTYDYPGTIAGSAGTIWDTWDQNGVGTISDADLNNTIFSSPDLSLSVTGDDPGGAFANDLILKFPNTTTYTTGTYEFRLKVYVEEGFGGYLNLGGSYLGYATNHEIGARLFLNADGTGQLDVNDPVTFVYNLAEWNDVRIVVNLDNNTKSLYLNEDLIVTDDTWDAPSGFGLVNFFGIAYNSVGLLDLVSPQMYIDDVELIQTSTTSTTDNAISSANFRVYPTVNSGQFTVDIASKVSSDASVTITNSGGRLIETSAIRQPSLLSFDLDVSSGTYYVNIVNGNQVLTHKIVVVE